jgi:type II secretory pathway pseudopilin PulG
MGIIKQAGFTIVETTLFLGISSFLIITLIVGTGNSVNVQRYNDAVVSFKALIQQQYADITSVQNSRNDNWSCGSSAVPTTTGAVKVNRGQSDCLILGKYVRIEDDKIDIYSVTGYQNSLPVEGADDILTLKNSYTMSVANDSVDSRTLEWGAKISYPVRQNNAPSTKPQNPRKMGILIVRSPESGQIYTFTNSDNSVPDAGSLGSASIASMVVAGTGDPGQARRVVCINSAGLLANDGRAVVIGDYASSASAIEVQTNEYMTAKATGTQC